MSGFVDGKHDFTVQTMNAASRIMLAAAAVSHLLTACATGSLKSTDLGTLSFADTQPVALRITVSGKAERVLRFGTTGQLVLIRKGASNAISIDFENGALGVYELPPGDYSIAIIGPLACSGLAFEIAPGGGAVALGSLMAKVIENDNYDLALMSGVSATDAELTGIAQGLKAAPETIASQPVYVPNSALCHQDRLGPGQTVLTDEESVQAATGLIVITAILLAVIAVTTVGNMPPCCPIK